MTGNTMLIAQPAPSYEQVLPNMSALTEGMVVLFCNSIDDVARAQMLVVDREQYRGMVHHRQQVCPVFSNTRIADDVIDQLPDAAVPNALLQSAQAMPEAIDIRTTLHGPANRLPMLSRHEIQVTDSDSQEDEQEIPGVHSYHAGAHDE